MIIKVPAFETLKKVSPHLNPPWAAGASCHCLPTTWPSCADPKHNDWAGHSPLAFHSAQSPSQVFEFKMVLFVFF
jgi:hypothetical protein